MARRPRNIQGGLVYHVLNRATARTAIFRKDEDYAAFERVLGEAHRRIPVRILTYVLMPNHFHLVLWPRRGQGRAVSEFMRWLQVTHTQRWHAHYHTAGTGHLYQGRFKAFPVQGDGSVRKVCKYVERNPLRARLCERAEAWRWSGLHWRLRPGDGEGVPLADWPEGTEVEMGRWLDGLNVAGEEEAELAAMRESVRRGRPFGAAEWMRRISGKLDLGHTLRPRGRPRKAAVEDGNDS